MLLKISPKSFYSIPYEQKHVKRKESSQDCSDNTCRTLENNYYYPLLGNRKFPNFQGSVKQINEPFGICLSELEQMQVPQRIKKLKELFTNSETIKDSFISFLHLQNLLSNKDLTSIANEFGEKIGPKDLNYMIKSKITLTPVDTPELLEHRIKCLQSHIYNVNDEEYTKNIDNILMHEFALVNQAKSNKEMIIVSGLPASGKSTYINQHYNLSDYYLGDVDEIKTLFPAYNTNGKEYNTFHDLARYVFHNIIMKKVFENNKNIIIPITGISEYIEKLSKHAKEKDYNVTLIHVQIPKEEAMKNLMERYYHTGRYIDPFFITIRAPFMDKIVTDFKHSPLIDKLIVIDSPLWKKNRGTQT